MGGSQKRKDTTTRTSKRSCRQRTTRNLALSFERENVEDTTEYKVEQVVGEKDGLLQVKWVGWDEPTWEPIERIPPHFYENFKKKSALSSQVKKKTKPSVDVDTRNDSKEYKVERVVGEKDGLVQVKWVGWDEPTWEPIERIPPHFYEKFKKHSTPKSIKQFIIPEKKASQAKKKIQNPVSVRSESDGSDASIDYSDSEGSSDEYVLDDEVESMTKKSSNAVSSAQVGSGYTVTCTICNDEEKSGRLCVSCNRPVHHMCSIELLESIGADEALDTCFCSEKCYNTVSKPTTDLQTTTDKETTPKKKDAAISEASNSLVGKSVAFSQSKEDWMSPKLYTSGSLILEGIITRQRKGGKGQIIPDQYEIRWTNSQFQSKKHIHYITRSKVEEGIANYQCMIGANYRPESWEILCKPFHETSTVSDIWEEFQEVEESLVRFESPDPSAVDLVEVEKMKSMDFRPDVYLAAPKDLFRHDDGGIETRLKKEKVDVFKHSAVSSFFAFLPISFWQRVVECTNSYAAKWKQPLITLEEMMKFLGILFYISTVDKGEYSNYWGEQVENKMFGEISVGLDSIMSLRRFKFIRKNLCFREEIGVNELKSDPVARIRPLINMLKLRSPAQIELGRNVAVDESSIACRSKYGRHLIVYNATKPTGKYHFKIYMCCCSTTWYAIGMKLHCASGLSERLEGLVEPGSIEHMKEAIAKSAEVRKHVLEVTYPIHNTKRIVNTDNFYTSCQLLEALRLVGLYGRGTIRENSKFGPKCFMMSKSDKVPRGTIRQGVDLQHRIVGASWSDGSIVNILSNADDASLCTVTRLVGRKKVSFEAPTCIRQYNQAMQGVDRIDQLRSRFSIADGHTFQKWHKKLAMAYIDIARCNAYIARKMSGALLDSRDPHRQFIMELSSELIHGDWEDVPYDTGLLLNAPSSCKSIHMNVSPCTRTPSPSKVTVECTWKQSKSVFPTAKARRECVVCRFEGRNPSKQTIFCFYHNVSLCASDRSSPPVTPYYCTRSDLTCWEKYHIFYFPEGLYNINGHIRRSSNLFKLKKEAENSEQQNIAPVDQPPDSTESTEHQDDNICSDTDGSRRSEIPVQPDSPPSHNDVTIEEESGIN